MIFRWNTHRMVAGAACVAIGLVSGAGVVRGQETSVRPGINDSFQEPVVEQFVERFEKEGREVYDQRDTIIEACRLEPGMVVADVGAGTGLFSLMLAGKVGADGKVYAVDIAEEFVEHVVAKAKEEGIQHVEGVVCEPDFVNLPPASVDVVFICDTYHHFEFPYKTMASLHRALKPGGRVVLVEFSRVEGESSEWIMGHVRAGEEVFVREIEESGFRRLDELDGVFKESYLIRFERVEAGEKTEPQTEAAASTAADGSDK